MTPERQISVASTGIGLALALPTAVGVLKGFAAPSMAGPIIGSVLATAGVLFGTLIARAHPAISAVRIGVTLWLLTALIFGAMLVLVALQTAGLEPRVMLLVAALLPIAAWAFVITRPD